MSKALDILKEKICAGEFKSTVTAVFGTGALSDRIYKIFKDEEIDVAGFIDRERRDDKYSRPVWGEEDIPENIDTIVISSIQYQDIIADRLRGKYGNRFRLIVLDESSGWRQTKKSETPKGSGTILFVKESLHIRVQKHALSLKESDGYKTVLICASPVDLIDEAFDEIYVYENHRGLINILEEKDADLCLTYDLPDRVPRLCVEHAGCPVVYASHDSALMHNLGLKDGAESFVTDSTEDVKIIMAGSKAVTYKGNEFDWYRENFDTPEKLLRFDCYAMDRFVQKPTEKYSDKDGEMHVVMGGGVFSMKRDYSHACASQFLHIAPYFTEQKIHYHLYPASLLVQDYDEYHKYQEENQYFHIHEPQNYEGFLREMTKYDFAVPVHETRYRWEDPVLFDRIFPSKIFAFIEAGIPIISNLKAIGKFAEELGIGFYIPLDRMDKVGETIANADMNLLYSNIEKARQEWNMKRHIGKLSEFIKSMMEV